MNADMLKRALFPDTNYMNTFPVQWAWVKGYETYYAVNMNGQVFSFHSNKLLKPNHSGKNRYLKVVLQRQGTRRTISVHRLVYESFHGEIPKGYEVDHINGDRFDNRLANLQILTAQDHRLKSNKVNVTLISLRYPYEKTYHNCLEIKQAGFDYEEIKYAYEHKMKIQNYLVASIS